MDAERSTLPLELHITALTMKQVNITTSMLAEEHDNIVQLLYPCLSSMDYNIGRIR